MDTQVIVEHYCFESGDKVAVELCLKKGNEKTTVIHARRDWKGLEEAAANLAMFFKTEIKHETLTVVSGVYP